MISVTIYEKRPNSGLHTSSCRVTSPPSRCTPIFNILLVRPVIATTVILVVLPFVIYWVFQQSERALRAWLDSDLDSKVQLLESIQTGTFLDSNSGRYLAVAARAFPRRGPCRHAVLRALHGELALRAKGVLLLRESGMEELPIDAETAR
jgi:hypothetical protein